MSDFPQTPNNTFMQDVEVKKIPSTLNVLTILTFIGCGISLLSGIYTFVSARTSYEAMEKMHADGTFENLPSFMKNMAGPEALEMMRKTYENRVPMIIIGLIGVGLCLYGAIEMRKLHKQGFYMWLLGELLPVIGTGIFIGLGVFKGLATLGFLIPVVFIILYATQLKYTK